MLLLLQFVCVLVLSLVTGLYRSGMLGFKPFAAIFALALLSILVVGLFILGQCFFAWWQGNSVSTSFWIAVVLAILTWSIFIAFVVCARVYPLIHQITTDRIEPPVFTHATTIRAASDNSLVYTDKVATIQQGAYPHVQTQSFSIPPAELFSQALDVANAMAWTIEYTNIEELRFEATARSTVFGFVDDIAVRVKFSEVGSAVDLRSVSRVGRGDFGANAKRITTFQSLLKEKVSSLK